MVFVFFLVSCVHTVLSANNRSHCRHLRARAKHVVEQQTFEIQGSRGQAHCIVRCRLCERVSYMNLLPDTIEPYEDSGNFAPFVCTSEPALRAEPCREPVRFRTHAILLTWLRHMHDCMALCCARSIRLSRTDAGIMGTFPWLDCLLAGRRRARIRCNYRGRRLCRVQRGQRGVGGCVWAGIIGFLWCTALMIRRFGAHACDTYVHVFFWTVLHARVEHVPT